MNDEKLKDDNSVETTESEKNYHAKKNTRKSNSDLLQSTDHYLHNLSNS